MKRFIIAAFCSILAMAFEENLPGYHENLELIMPDSSYESQGFEEVDFLGLSSKLGQQAPTSDSMDVMLQKDQTGEFDTGKEKWMRLRVSINTDFIILRSNWCNLNCDKGQYQNDDGIELKASVNVTNLEFRDLYTFPTLIGKQNLDKICIRGNPKCTKSFPKEVPFLFLTGYINPA
jgi:hypothetical protein